MKLNRSMTAAVITMVMSSISFPLLAESKWQEKIPKRPVINLVDYPNCKDEWWKERNRVGLLLNVQNCINKISEYHKYELNRFPGKVKEYDNELNKKFALFNRPPNKPAHLNEFREFVSSEQKWAIIPFAYVIDGMV